MFNEKRKTLNDLIKRKEFFLAPGVFDMLSARIADTFNFKAIYMTGYGSMASYLGVADAGLASYTDMLNRVTQIASGTSKPLIADADTGYGGLINIAQTVKGYENAGACALHIEDQSNPKKCGHTPGKKIITSEEMELRIKVAVDAKNDSNFLIIARTDSRSSEGLDKACVRAEKYYNAGADIIFIEAPANFEEVSIIAKRFSNLPIMINMAEAGITPIISLDKLKDMGFAFAIYPGTAFSAAASAIKGVYSCLLSEGSSSNLNINLLTGLDMHKLMGFEDVWKFEEKWDIDDIKEDDPTLTIFKNN